MSSITRAWTSALAFSALSTLAASGAQASSVLSSQAPDPSGTLYLSLDTTQNAETFTLASAGSITGLRWYGGTADTSGLTVRLFNSTPDLNPDTYSTLSGVPGATLTRSAAPVFSIDISGFQVPIFEYELTLASAIAAAASQTYAVSIFSSVENWGWQSSAQGDGVSYFRGGDTTPWSSDVPDLSLTVLGPDAPVGVPEPGSLALVGLALAGVAASRRRAA